MQIEAIPLCKLEDFARRHVASDADAAAGIAVTPISLHRARAWTRNPLAEPDDIALITGFDDSGRCIGYLGMLPGLVRHGERHERIYWGSTYYVPPAARDTGVGMRMISRWLKLKRSIVATGVSRVAGRALRGFRFKTLGHLPYRVANLNRVDLASLPFRALRRASSGGVDTSSTLDRLVDTARLAHKLPLYAMLTASAGALGDWRARPIECLGGHCVEDLNDHLPYRFSRPPETIDWMLKEPWITPDADSRTPGYYFNDHRPLFEYHAYALEPHGMEARGFAVFRLDRKHGNRNLTLFDHGFRDPADSPILWPLAMREARRHRADKIVLPEVCGPQIDASPVARRLFAPAEREYFYYPMKGSLLKKSIEGLELSLPDGDIAFA